MKHLTTQQIKNALIEMETMQTNPDISAASVLACNELEKRMGEDAFNEWFDSI